MPSIFSKIIAGEIPSYKIAEDERFFAFLDINPVARGHLLVVPKLEVDYLFALEDDLLAAMILFSKRIALAIKSVIDCKRVGIIVLGFDVAHAHIHLIPINKATDLNLSNPKLSLEKDEFVQIAKNIEQAVRLLK